MAVYDVTPRAAAPPPTATSTAAPGPRVLGAVAPHGGGAVTVAPGGTVRLDLDLVDETGGALTVAALPRAPVIGWYLPVDAHAHRRQYEARVAVVFEETFPDRRPRAPLASVAGEPGSVLYSAPAGASGEVVVRAVTAAADCPGGGGGTDRYAAAAWDGPCSAEFTITVVPAVSIAAVSPAVGEGSAAQFTVSRTGGTASALTVAVSVSETGSTFSGPPPASVAIAAGASATALDVATVDDEVREDDSVVTATLTAPAGYVAGRSGSATVTVEDDETLPSTVLRYDAYDTTGAVTQPGSYAFLMPGDGDSMSVANTYEQLRAESTLLRLSVTDASGVSRVAFYDGVRTGDILEWRQADDCFVRYVVNSATPDAAEQQHKELAVGWLTYAYSGCSGAIPNDTAYVFQWSPSTIRFPDMTVPVRHGPWLLTPRSWGGVSEQPQRLGPAAVTAGSHEESHDPAAVRAHPLWREPRVPDGWTLVSASVGWEGQNGINTLYANERGYLALQVQITFLEWTRQWPPSANRITEVRLVDGRVAFVQYGAPGQRFATTTVRIFDDESGVEYLLFGLDPKLSGTSPDALVEIARSLLERPDGSGAR